MPNVTGVVVVHFCSFVGEPPFRLSTDQPAPRDFEDTENRLSIAYVSLRVVTPVAICLIIPTVRPVKVPPWERFGKDPGKKGPSRQRRRPRVRHAR